MRLGFASIDRHAASLIVAAGLLIGACGGGNGNGSDGGRGGGGNAAGGAGGRGGGGGTTGSGGAAGTTGSGGGAGTLGNAGAGGRGGAGGAGGGTAGSGAAGHGGVGGAAGTGGAAGHGGAGGGASCTTPSGCAADQYCDFASNRCAALGGGTCQARPQGCTAVVDPVCACDGNVYTSPCEAAAAGSDISNNGTCPPPSGMFPCGARFCMHGAQYCEQMIGGAVDNPGAYACHALPAGCGTTPTCACLAGVAQCTICTTSASGDVTTTCAFP